MPNYTITTGGSAKLLATDADTTRTVTSLKGLPTDDARRLARHLTQVDPDLARWTADPAEFAAQATALGVRTAQVHHDGVLTVSVLADQPGRALQYGPTTYAVHHIAGVLDVAEQLPDAARRAVRAELRGLLARYDGPVVTATVRALDGVVTINAAAWCADGAAEHLTNLLIGSWPDNYEAAEAALWFYSATGAVLDGLAHELLAAEQDLDVSIDPVAVAERLARTRPVLVRSILREAEAYDYPGDLEDDQVEAIDRARAILATAS